MKVYDIVKEARQVGRGDYAGFVWDQPTGSRNITVTFPDGRTTTVTSQADARRVADDWIARSRAPAGTPPDSPDRNTPSSGSNRAGLARRAWDNKWRAFRRGISLPVRSIGIGQAVWDELERVMRDLHDAHYALPENDPNYLTQQQYQFAVQRAFGAWLVGSLLPTVVGAARTASKIGAVVRAIRAANLTATGVRQAMSLAGGPAGAIAGAVVNLAIFVLLELGLYFATRFILNSDKGREMFINFIVGQITGDFFAAVDVAAGEVASRVASALSRQDAEDMQVDLRRITGMSPEEIRSRETGTDRRVPQQPAAQGSAPAATGGNRLLSPNLSN